MKTKKWAIKSLIILVVFLLLTLLTISYFTWRDNFRDNIYPGVMAGSLDLSGKTVDAATELLDKKTSVIINNGIIFQYGNKKVTIDPSASSFDADLSYPLLVFNNEETINQAISYNQPKTFWNYLLFKFKPKSQKQIIPFYTLDEERLKNSLSDSFKELEIAPTNSSFSVSETSGELQANPERLGKEINFDLVFSELRDNLTSLNPSPIIIKTRSKYPEVKASDLSPLEDEAKKIIDQAGLELTFNSDLSSTSTQKTWIIKPDKLIGWLSVVKNNDNLSLSLDKDKINQYISLNISPKIDQDPVRPRFEIVNGKVVSWQTGVNGRKVDIIASVNKITSDFLNGQKEIPLIMQEISGGTIAQEDTLNIKEIIGTGHSNFAGSTSNRRKNIQVGAAAVNGLLLAPNEEFSLVKALGDVSEKTGYLPELVIKGNKTLPEYGGGLCQVGTTLFRSALGSGLPITYRRNHSYRVSYYEPAGMDAAVYIPQPDVRFVNDTGNYILIQSRINKNDIYFDFWGTKDGRIATTTTPVVYNIVKPAPTKYVESPDLALGQKKCTEHAHNGADAYFDYKVIYPPTATSTPIKEKRFSSHYVPWQEVCLIGKGTATTSPATATEINNPTSTATTTHKTSSSSLSQTKITNSSSTKSTSTNK